jgi:hypothetical protein
MNISAKIWVEERVLLPIPVAKQSKARVCGRSLAGIAGSNLAGSWMSVSCKCCVLSGLCDRPIPHPEESYRLYCVMWCDPETSRMRRACPRCAKGKSLILSRCWRNMTRWCGLSHLAQDRDRT